MLIIFNIVAILRRLFIDKRFEASRGKERESLLCNELKKVSVTNELMQTNIQTLYKFAFTKLHESAQCYVNLPEWPGIGNKGQTRCWDWLVQCGCCSAPLCTLATHRMDMVSLNIDGRSQTKKSTSKMCSSQAVTTHFRCLSTCKPDSCTMQIFHRLCLTRAIAISAHAATITGVWYAFPLQSKSEFIALELLLSSA